MLKIKLLFILTVHFVLVNGQASDSPLPKRITTQRSLCLLAGFSFGKNAFTEIGISRNDKAIIGYHPAFSSYFFSCELKPSSKVILGPKIGGWISGAPLALGMNMIYYTDFDNGSLSFRPEAGLALENFKFVYGYNAILTKHKLDGINRHVGSIVYCFRLKQLKDRTDRIR